MIGQLSVYSYTRQEYSIYVQYVTTVLNEAQSYPFDVSFFFFFSFSLIVLLFPCSSLIMLFFFACLSLLPFSTASLNRDVMPHNSKRQNRKVIITTCSEVCRYSTPISKERMPYSWRPIGAIKLNDGCIPSRRTPNINITSSETAPPTASDATYFHPPPTSCLAQLTRN